MKKKVFNIAVIVTSLVVMLYFVLTTDGIEGLYHQMVNLKYAWICLAVLCMLAYWFSEAIILHIITSFLYAKQRLRDSFKATMVGQFFNSITPFASGGQPAQVYVLMKDGVDGGHAGSIVMIKFIIFQAVLTVYSFIIIFLKASFFQSYMSQLFFFVIIGFAVHTSVILVAILFSYNRKITHVFLMLVFKFLKAIRIVKNAEEAERKLEQELVKFHDNASILKSNVPIMIKTTLLTILQLSFFFVIPYCVYRAFGLSGDSLWNLIAAEVFVTMVISFIPLPGATGGAEGGFMLFFKMFFEGNTLITAMLIWRIITFYSCIGFGGLFTVISPQKPLKTNTN